MNHEIRIFGDPVLRVKAEPVPAVDAAVQDLAREMISIMHESDGVGLAAQQIGETKAVCVIDVPEEYDLDDDGNRLNPDLVMPMILINPVLSQPSRKTDAHDEGCLSFPGIRGSITRPSSIHLHALDEEGKTLDVEVRGFLARVIQHEVDHLNGVLFIDRMSAAKRFTLGPRLKRLRSEGA